ncbi:hypothetical protein SteCoe_12336 [Stentor coeruleus]|uniref:Uncharacterized protein n=1 Tax=Stentor coeruleus TaxID=5963 RepID=A0A1R2CB16_9CILI|nr:hypothetical protein SteCoe_12336 [Stentor coeruleus]
MAGPFCMLLFQMEEINFHEIIESDKDPSNLSNQALNRLISRLNHPRVKRLSSDSLEKTKKRPSTTFTPMKPVPPGYEATKPVIRFVN